MSKVLDSGSLPIIIQEDGLYFDPSTFVIQHEVSFKTKMLRHFYLNSVTVFPKIVYKSYWFDDVDNSFAKLGFTAKATIIFPDIIGIEYAKTKTIVSKGSVRIVECIAGSGVIIVQPEIRSLTEEIVPHLIEMFPGTKMIVPTHWSYTLVNIGKDAFATVELIQKDKPLHITYNQQRGAPLYLIERNGTVEIVKNSKYKNVQKYVKLNSNEYLKKFSVKQTPTVIQQFCESCECFKWFFEDNQQDWESTLYTAVIGKPYSFSD